MNVTTMSSLPSTMPSNNWWTSVGQFANTALTTYAQIATARAQSGIAAPAGVLASSPMNPTPGTAGRNIQASSTAGGARQPFSTEAAQAAMGKNGLMIAGAVAFVLLLIVLKGR